MQENESAEPIRELYMLTSPVASILDRSAVMGALMLPPAEVEKIFSEIYEHSPEEATRLLDQYHSDEQHCRNQSQYDENYEHSVGIYFCFRLLFSMSFFRKRNWSAK